jgi:hypothetical protein
MTLFENRRIRAIKELGQAEDFRSNDHNTRNVLADLDDKTYGALKNAGYLEVVSDVPRVGHLSHDGLLLYRMLERLGV